MTNTKQTLFKFIEGIKKKYDEDLCTNYKNLEYSDTKNFVFKPLEIEGANGFIVYSKKIIKSSIVVGSDDKKEKLYDKFKDDYKKCKDYQNLKNNGELYTHRYFYYEKLPDTGKLVTIIMLNPAFASSEKDDLTIKNIKSFIKRYNDNSNNEGNEIGAFEIINLYSVRMPKSDKLKEILKCVNNKTNLKFIKKYIKFTQNEIILAYGAKYLLKDAKLTSSLSKKRLYAIKINKKSETPTHFLACQYDKNLKDCNELKHVKIIENSLKIKIKL